MRRLLPMVVATGLAAATPAVAETPHVFDRMDVFELEWVSDPLISADGRRIVYRRNAMDVMTDGKTSRLWIVDADGDNNLPLTSRDADESNAAWSPDGSRIAFTSGTDHGSEIFVYWVDERKLSRLTQLDRSPSGLSWSPDGESLAFSMLVPEEPVVLVTPPAKPDDAEWAEAPRVTSRLVYERDGAGYIEPGFNHFFVVPAIGGTPRQVTTGDFHHLGQPQWTPDGSALVFSANRNDDWEFEFLNSEIYRVDIASGAITALTERNGPDEEPVVSPDGRRIAFVGFDDKVQTYQVSRLYVMNADGSGRRELMPDFDRSVSGIRWDSSGQGIYFQYDDRGDTKIAHVSLSGRQRDVARQLGGTTIGRPYGGGSFSVADSGRIAYTHVTPYRPADLAVVSGRGEPRVLTALNADLLDYRALGDVEEIWYKASTDGRDIQGWIVKPPGYETGRAYPLIV
ncbi:MAG: S9 family peptidase, partial [Woeseiaceae bacterium]|nr:S9 family peptidase [Woeseiaceae bacterium]